MAQALALWLAFAIYPQASGEISGHVTAEIEAEVTNQPIQTAQARLYSLEQVLSTKSGPAGGPAKGYTLMARNGAADYHSLLACTPYLLAALVSTGRSQRM